MTTSQTTDSTNTGYALDFRKHWMGFALALSIALHIGAALVFIIAGSFSVTEKNSASFIIQDIALTPSISAPAKSITATPSALPPPMTSSPSPAAEQEAVNPAQEAETEQPSESAASPGKEGGLMSTPLGLGMTYGYFSGLADGRSLRDDIRGYYFDMVEKINREWWNKAGLLKEPLRQDGIFELLVQRDGTIVSISRLQGTGSSEADRLLTEIIRVTSPLPPLPSTYNLELFRAPIKIKAPSFLLRLAN